MHAVTRTTIPMLTLAAALAFAGCDDGPEPTRGQSERTIAPDAATQAESPSESDPRSASARAGCSLLTEQQVEQALGYDAVMNDDRSGHCLVTPASGTSDAPAVDFKVESRVAAYDYFAAQPDAEAIAGLGERAVWATINDMTGNVVAVVGGRAVVVAVARADGLDRESRQQAEALARALVEALR